VADFAAAGRTGAAGLTDRVGREVVVQHEGGLVGPRQAVDILLVLAGAEGGNDDGLGLAAGEQRRAVGARQKAHFRDDRAHGREITAVDAALGLEDGAADDLGLQRLEDRADDFGREAGLFALCRCEVLLDLGLDLIDGA
jgi:hypothetical protein